MAGISGLGVQPPRNTWINLPAPTGKPVALGAAQAAKEGVSTNREFLALVCQTPTQQTIAYFVCLRAKAKKRIVRVNQKRERDKIKFTRDTHKKRKICFSSVLRKLRVRQRERGRLETKTHIRAVAT